MLESSSVSQAVGGVVFKKPALVDFDLVICQYFNGCKDRAFIGVSRSYTLL